MRWSLSICLIMYKVAALDVDALYFHDPPWVFAQGAEPTGMAVDALTAIIEDVNSRQLLPFNITLHFVKSNQTHVGWFYPGTGQWSGLLSQLAASDNAAVTVNPVLPKLAVTTSQSPSTAAANQLVQRVGVPHAWAIAPIKLLMLQPDAANVVWRFLAPFPGSIWAIIAGVTLTSAAAFWFIDRVSPYGFSKDDASKYTVAAAADLSIQMYFQKGAHMPSSIATRTVFVSGSFFLLFIAAAYSSGLNALQLGDQLSAGINSLEDITRLHDKFAVVNNSVVHGYFQQSQDYTTRKQVASMVLASTFESAIDMLQARTVRAIADFEPALRYFSAVGVESDVIISASQVTPAFLAFAGSPQFIDSPASKTAFALNDAVARWTDVHSMSAVLAPYIPAASIAVASVERTTGESPVLQQDLDQFQGIFYVFSIAAALAWCILFVEREWKCLMAFCRRSFSSSELNGVELITRNLGSQNAGTGETSVIVNPLNNQAK